MNEETCLFDVTLLKQAQIEYTLKEVYDALLERGFDPIKQMVGYLATGDATYISKYKNSRDKMKEIDRNFILSFLLENYLQ